MDTPAKGDGRVGAHAEIITGALLARHPERLEREIVDDLRVTALYVEYDGATVCLLSYDVCELPRSETDQYRQTVSDALGIARDHVHCFCTHTHSSSMSAQEHDMAIMQTRSRAAALGAHAAAAPVEEVYFLGVDTGRAFNINRRTAHGGLGTWCLMQSQGCLDDGVVVDGTEWVRGKILEFGASAKAAAAITGPFLANRPNDPFLELVLFPRAGGGYAGGLVRFTAHAVICSAGYWRPNFGRDYPGALCDRLGAHFGCPVLFLQGPCGDHRPRHGDVGPEERDRIAFGLADTLLGHSDALQRFPFDRLELASAQAPCALSDEFPASEAEAQERIKVLTQQLDSLPPHAHLKMWKELHEARSFAHQALSTMRDNPYLVDEEIAARKAKLEVSCIRFGGVRLLNFPGEMFSTVVSGLENAADGPVVVTAFADGVTGYMMSREEYLEGAMNARGRSSIPATSCISAM